MLGSRLKVDYLGYEPQELRVPPSQTTRLALSSKAIDDVVVVGYGTVKRRDLVGCGGSGRPAEVIGDRSTGNAGALPCKASCRA